MSNAYSLRRWRRRSSSRSGCREVSSVLRSLGLLDPASCLKFRFFLGSRYLFLSSRFCCNVYLPHHGFQMHLVPLQIRRAVVPSPGRKGVAFGRSCVRTSPRREAPPTASALLVASGNGPSLSNVVVFPSHFPESRSLFWGCQSKFQRGLCACIFFIGNIADFWCWR